MKRFSWSPEKNEKLQQERGISFEEIVFHIENGYVLEVTEHPNQQKYGGQRVLSVLINRYVYLVPLVETEDEIFLKTIIPSRKATKRHLRGQTNNGET